MKNYSIWKDFKYTNISDSLNQDIVTDVLIIGGGITGMSTLFHLIKSGLNVTLVEKNTIGLGVTKNTTGKLTFMQDNIYTKLKNFHNLNKAKLYLESQIESIKMVKNIIETNNIDCDFELTDSFVFTSDNNDHKLYNEEHLLKKLGIKIKRADYLPSGEKVKAIFSSNTYVFHPLKYLYKLKEICVNNGANIYENTKIVSIDKINDYYICKTDKYRIKTKYVVLATHYPYFIFPFLMPFKCFIEKSYIEAFKTDHNFNYSAIGLSKPIVSIRYHKNYQIYLSNSHNTVSKDNYTKNFANLMRSKVKNPDYVWSNKDIITYDYLPFIGSINNKNYKNFLIATGYNTWGMTNGSLAGKILSDIILEKENKYIELFNPSRGINKGFIINFPLIIASNVISFAKSKIIKKKPWYSQNIRFEKRNGKSVGIYTSDEGKEYMVYNTCPHLKCNLLFNEVEKTWDCPCHGSRFDIYGHAIEGPSNYDIAYEKNVTKK